MEDKIVSLSFGSAKRIFKKKKSLTRHYSTYLRFLEGFLFTTTTTQGVRFHQNIR